MSAINGDKARFNKKRKARLARKVSGQILRKKIAAAGAPPAPTGAQL